MAAGSKPFHVWSRTRTIAVPGAWRPTNSARPRASGSLTSGDRTSTSTGLNALDQELLGRGGGLHPADLVELDLERSRQLLAEGLRRPDGDDAGFCHVDQAFPSSRLSGTIEKGIA